MPKSHLNLLSRSLLQTRTLLLRTTEEITTKEEIITTMEGKEGRRSSDEIRLLVSN
jgi:hypothetical protein